MDTPTPVNVVDLAERRAARRPWAATEAAGRLLHARLVAEAMEGLQGVRPPVI